VVDQDVGRLIALQHLLHEHGYVVLGTSDPEEALAAVDLGRVSLLLIDVSLAGPQAEGVLARLAARGLRIPTVVVGARSAHRRHASVRAYLGTPVGPMRTLRVVARIVGAAVAA
jgi:DNA-binding NtrC family response regulator